MTQILWQPSKEHIKQSCMFQLIEAINQRHKLSISNYFELHRWSIGHLADFWESIWHDNQVISSHESSEILSHSDRIYHHQWFKGAKLNFSQNLLRINNNETAIISIKEQGGTRQLSYHELNLQVAKVAAYLRQIGIKPNDRVAAVLPNCPETIIGALATISIGAIWSGCSPDFGSDSLQERFNQIEPKVLFMIDHYRYKNKIIDCTAKREALLKNSNSITHVIDVSYNDKDKDILEQPRGISMQQLLSTTDKTELEFEQLPFNHPIYIMFSSGTTGKPKCIVHSSGGTLLQHLKELKYHVNLTSCDNIFFYTTCSWMMWNWLISSLALGATVVLYEGCPFYPQPERLLNLIDQHQISVFGVGAKLIEYFDTQKLKPIKSHKLTSLKTILTTGSPLLPPTYDYIYQSIKHDVQVSSITGGTDIISCFALGNPMLPVYRGEIQAVGLGMDVHIFNKQGESVINQQGELVCLSPFPSMPIGFWNDPDNHSYHNAYFNTFNNVWAHGDYALINDRGGIIMLGRSDTTLNPGGVRIGTAEIYRQLKKIDCIQEGLAICTQVNNSEQIILYVVLKAEVLLDNNLTNLIKKTLKTHASPHHVPALIKQVKDLPRTLSGKIAELAVKNTVENKPIKNLSALANPEVLHQFKL